MLKDPRAFSLAVMPLVWKLPSPVSASLMLRVPVSVRLGVLASSVTAPMASPAITAASLVPLMLTVRVWSTKAPLSSMTRAV